MSPEGSSKCHHPISDPVGGEDNGFSLEAEDNSDPTHETAKAREVIAVSKARWQAVLSLRQRPALRHANEPAGNPVAHSKARQA
jgi:hypothetical protein